MTWNARKWVRVRDGVYELRNGFEALVGIERHDHGMSGHFALWTVSGVRMHFPTMRDAKRFAEQRLEKPKANG